MSVGNVSRLEAAHRSTRIEVLNQSVELDVRGAPDPANTTFPVRTTVEFTTHTDETWLDFLGGRVDAVEVDGAAVEVEYDGARITLRNLRTDAPVTVGVSGTATYSRHGQGLHRFVDPADGETYLYTQYEPADARRVFPDFEQPDLKTRFTFIVTAPDGWLVASNRVEQDASPADGGGVRHAFEPTLVQSSYLTAIIAGPYHRVTDEWVSPSGQQVALGLLCRASLAQYLDADELFTITKQGLAFFDEAFAYAYPWGKYEQVFVPEYNLGAMENPGCVTFTESHLFRSAATTAQRQARANTIMHEMSHMWFGDLVTPKWWDDLWLKESFAEYMGSHANAAATRFKSAWVAFAGGRKAWAYAQDQLPTTHPIVAEVVDLEAARQTFDGITYAKGASALKQLVAHVGVDTFFAASSGFFAAHEFGNATLADFLAALAAASGRDLEAWSRAWLQRPGVDTLTPVIEVNADGNLADVRIERSASLPGDPRPHTLDVGCYRLAGDRLVRDHGVHLDLPATEEPTKIEELLGTAAPDLMIINDTDLTFAKIRFDDRSLETLRTHLSKIDDPLARAVVWGALWSLTRDAALPAATYLALVVDHAGAETDPATLTVLTTNALVALDRYAPADQRPGLAEAWFQDAWTLMGAAPAGSDAQLIWLRAALGVAPLVPRSVPTLKRLLAGQSTIDGLHLDPDLRWRIVTALASLDAISDDELAAERDADQTAEGHTRHLTARTSRPDAKVKADAWRVAHTPGSSSNDEVDALVAGLQVSGQAELILPFAPSYFEGLNRVWDEFPIEMAQRLVRGLYPSARDAVPGGLDAHPEVLAARDWLDSNPDAPHALRRVVIEELDNQERALRAQAAS